MKTQLLQLFVPLLLGSLQLCRAACGADALLTVDVGNPGHPISPRLVGVFFEDINFGADGGLNAELIKNGSFEFPQPLMGWSEINAGKADGEIQVGKEEPAFAENPHYLRISSSTGRGEVGVTNSGFRGIGVRRGERYIFSTQARAGSDDRPAVRLVLTGADGRELAAAQIDDIGAQWSKTTAVLAPIETDSRARLSIVLAGKGVVDLDMVSLYPQKTWKDRPHGLRADLVQKLADLKPAFLRFPGGCIVEGSELESRYQWKRTIGERPQRKLIVNRWNTVFSHRPTPDYFQSFGLGFYEYFQLAEDLGAEPLPILNCGMACQFQSGELAPLEELDPYIQDALDLIEFANGPSTSRWGARRAAMGHPEPFGMKLLGVGNEQWGPQYFERYKIFAQILQEKHPEIELVSSTGPFPSGQHFDFAWPMVRRLPVDIVDEHCYAMPDWFLRAATRYDDYDRQGPQVFMGEYAAQSVDIASPDNRNNLRCALAEAAFMTGIERNSDVVVMSAYAPLLAHEEAWQWRPNLIWFDNLHTYATPSYYVQQVFGQHRGDVLLPVELTDSRPPEPLAGRIGLSTAQSSAEFKDLRVTQDGRTIFETKDLANADELAKFRGRWNLRDGVIQQADPGATARASFGDYSWRDYTLKMKARKLAGREGFGLIFYNGPGGSHLQWNLGGGNNRQHALLAKFATHNEDDAVVEQIAGTIESDRWYDVEVKLNGSRVQCFLDGKLIHDVEIAPPNLPRLFATASQAEETGEVILKVVNAGDQAADVDVKLLGATDVGSSARVVLLHGDPEDENSLSEPQKVSPVARTIENVGPRFRYTFLPHSLTVLRLDVKQDGR